MLNDLSFQALASARMAQLVANMNGVLSAEQTYGAPVFSGLLFLFAGFQFLMLMYGQRTAYSFFNNMVRALIVSLLLTHVGAFGKWVEQPVFYGIPAALASIGTQGAGVPTNTSETVAAQFDKVSLASEAINTNIIRAHSSWSPHDIIGDVESIICNGAVQLFLGIMFGVWYIAQEFLAIIICFGGIVIIFELFERTRGLVDQWIGLLVGIITFGFATSILASIVMSSELQIMTTMNSAVGQSLPAAISMFFKVVTNVISDAITLVTLPLICGIGSGVASSLAAPTTLAVLRTAAAGRALGRAGR